MAEINKLNSEEMETYEKSVLEYDDIQDAMTCSLNEGVNEGVKRVAIELLKDGLSL